MLMLNLKLLVKKSAMFFLGYALLVMAAILMSLIFSKAENFIFLNPYHTQFLNQFFYYITYLGDGIFSVALALIFLIFKGRKLCLLVISSYALSGIIAQSFKYFITEARPAMDSGLAHYNYFIKDITLHGYSSFPSGHAASAFSLACILAFYFRNNKLNTALLIFATLVGYSRIYLGNHFLTDVLAGSFIGVVSAIVCWLGLKKRLELI